MYEIKITNRAFKELSKVKQPYYSKLKESILKLKSDPRPNGCKKLKGRDAHRIRVGFFRIIYEIFDEELVIDIITIRQRKDAY